MAQTSQSKRFKGSKTRIQTDFWGENAQELIALNEILGKI